MEIADDIGGNYDQLRRDRGITWDQMADEMARQDPRLALWMREQGKKRTVAASSSDASLSPQHEVARHVAAGMVGEPGEGVTGPIDRASIHQEMARLAALLGEDEGQATHSPQAGTQSNGEPPEGVPGDDAAKTGGDPKAAAAKTAARRR